MSDSDQDRDPRFTKALFGRILAVGLFVAAGTFAVMQMMNRGSAVVSETSETGGASERAELDSETGQPFTPTAVSGDLEKSTSSNSAPIKTASVFRPGPTPPSAPPPRNSTLSSSFQPSVPPGNRSFKPLNSPPKAPPIVAAKPPSSPPITRPNRYAQLPNSGPPIIGSGGGFGERPAATPGAPPASPNFNPPNSGQANSQNLQNLLENAASDTTAAAQALLDQAKTSTTDAAKKLTDSVPALNVNRSPLAGQNPSPTSNPFAGQSAPKSFEPPPLRPAAQGGRPTPPPTISPTMKAPQPAPAKMGFQPGAAPRPIATPTRPPTATGFGSQLPATAQPVRSRLQSSPETPKQELAPEQSKPAATRPQIPAQPVSNPRQPALVAPAGRAPATLPRTANVPGDRELDGVQAPSLTVEKISPREIQVNSPADFEIVVRNVGRVVAEDVQVHDQIPAGTEFLDAEPKPSAATPDRRLQWNIGQLRPGEERRIRFQLKPVQPGEIGSVAHVTFATQASMRTLVTKPVLEIVHQAKPLTLIGDDVIFDVVVQNKGDGAAKNVLIQEDVPPQLQYQGGYRELEYEIGTLMPGQSKRVQLGLKAAQVGKFKNLIFASAAGGLRAQHEIDMQVVAPKLVATAGGPTRRYLQREVVHQFRVANQGTAPATNLDLIARLPAGLRFVSTDNRGRYDANSHAVLWKVAELPTGADAAVELVTVPVDVGDQNIRFETNADLKQTAAAEQKLHVAHLIDVFFDIDDVVDPIEIGSETRYRIKVVNQGTQAAANVQLQLEFPSGLTPTKVAGNLQNQIQGQRVQFAPISSLKPGDQLELMVSAQGQSAGDHRVILKMEADGRQTPVSKEETTRVYADR